MTQEAGDPCKRQSKITVGEIRWRGPSTRCFWSIYDAEPPNITREPSACPRKEAMFDRNICVASELALSLILGPYLWLGSPLARGVLCVPQSPPVLPIFACTTYLSFTRCFRVLQGETPTPNPSALPVYMS